MRTASMGTALAGLLLAGALCAATPVRADDPGPASVPSARDYDPPVPGTYALPPIKPAGDGAVLTTAGAGARLHDLMGDRLVLVSFVYGACRDAYGCPFAFSVLADLAAQITADPALAGKVRIVTLSFDPLRDTPAKMAALRAGLVSDDMGGADWRFLTTPDLAAVGPILSGYGQALDRGVVTETGDIAHLLRVYLVDRDKRVRNIYGLDYLYPPVMLADLKTLLLEAD